MAEVPSGFVMTEGRRAKVALGQDINLCCRPPHVNVKCLISLDRYGKNVPPDQRPVPGATINWPSTDNTSDRTMAVRVPA